MISILLVSVWITSVVNFTAWAPDGTVSANKNSIKIIGEHSDLAVQGFLNTTLKNQVLIPFRTYALGKQAIQSSYLVQKLILLPAIISVLCPNMIF